MTRHTAASLASLFACTLTFSSVAHANKYWPELDKHIPKSAYIKLCLHFMDLTLDNRYNYQSTNKHHDWPKRPLHKPWLDPQKMQFEPNPRQANSYFLSWKGKTEEGIDYDVSIQCR